MIGDALAKFRRPGMIKALAGQLAIAIGSSLVASTVEDAEERCDQAHEELEKLTARIEAGRAGMAALIEEGDFDVAVIRRAHELGYVRLVDQVDDDQAADDGDPRVCGECELRFEDVADLVDHRDRAHPNDRTPPNGAPNGKPDVPPRMAGGYLPAAGGLLQDAPVDPLGNPVNVWCSLCEETVPSSPDHQHRPDVLERINAGKANRAPADAD